MKQLVPCSTYPACSSATASHPLSLVAGRCSQCHLGALGLEQPGVFVGELGEAARLAPGQGANGVGGLLERTLSDNSKYPNKVLHEPVRHPSLHKALSRCLVRYVNELDGLACRCRQLFSDALVRDRLRTSELVRLPLVTISTLVTISS